MVEDFLLQEFSYVRQDLSNHNLFLNPMIHSCLCPPVPSPFFDSAFRAFFLRCSFGILCSASVELPLCLGPSVADKLSSRESRLILSEKTDPHRGVGVLVDAERLPNFGSGL